GALPVVFIFWAGNSYTLCGVFSGKYLRTISIVAIVTISIFSKPLWAFIIMFINDFCSKSIELLHTIFEVITLWEWSRTRHNNDIWVLFLYRIVENLITLDIIWSPLLISNTNIF